MLIVAFLMQTTVVSCLYGPFSIMLTTVETRTHSTRDVTSLGMMLVSITSGLLAPVAGNLAERFSLRLLAIFGLLSSALGYALLAASSSIQVFLVVYGLLIGPGVCLSAIVMPSVMVTRWFNVNRGRALGIVHMPILSMITPVIVVYLLKKYGLPTDYLFLAALIALIVLPALFIIDRPSGSYAPPAAVNPNGTPAGRFAGIVPIIRRPVFWALSLATTCALASGITLGTHLVPMVTQWGVPVTQAASLVSFGSLASIAGALVFGWLADKMGGARTIAVNCISSIALWALMLLHPGYLALAAIVALAGLNVAGVLPAYALTLSRIFGKQKFGPAYGAGTFVFMSLSPCVVPIVGAIFVRTGGYTDAILLLMAILAAGMLLALAADVRRTPYPLLQV
jgi:MFS family permease